MNWQFSQSASGWPVVMQGSTPVQISPASMLSLIGGQPTDAELTAIAALTPADGAVMIGNGTTWTADTTPTLTGLLTTNGQVAFPATQNPSADANTLDDYEEGSWTPALVATGCTFSYSNRGGSYTKIGRHVFGNGFILLNTTGNTLAANTITVSGLPFACSGVVNFPIRWSAMTTAAVLYMARTNQGLTTLSLEKVTAAATSISGVIGTDFSATAGSAIYFGFMYSV